MTAGRAARLDETGSEAAAGRWPRALAVGAACLALGASSLLLPYTLSGDEWCWLTWGRDVGRLALDTTSCTVWKPLPVLFTTPIAQTGDAAPMLWLLLVRTSWLLALVLAYRIGTRLGGRLAGVLAAVGLLLIPNPSADWLSYVRHGSSEPLIVAAILAAVDRHLARHRLQALGLACLAALGRPEAWIVVVAYGAVLWRAQAGRRLAIAALVATVPLLWLGGGAWGGRGPLSASRDAPVTTSGPPGRAASHGSAPSTPAGGRPSAGEAGSAGEPPRSRPAVRARLFAGLAVVVTSAFLVVLPIALLALAALVRALMAVRRNGSEADAVTAFLGVAALGWIAVQVIAGFLGFPVTSRFLVAPAAVICVLAGVGLAQTTRALRGGQRWVATAVLVAVIAAFAVPRVEALPAHLEGADTRGAWPSVIATLKRAKAQGVLRRCGNVIHAVDVGGKRLREIPWRLDVPSRAVRRAAAAVATPPPRGILVVQGHSYVIRHSGGSSNGRVTSRQLAEAGKWSVYEVRCRSGA